jgi:hypothetical protein
VLETQCKCLVVRCPSDRVRELGEREGKWGKVREREGKWRKGSNRIVEREREREGMCAGQ